MSSVTLPSDYPQSISLPLCTSEHKDDAFYFTLVTFKVEDCLFRVPRHELEQQSKVFSDMFASPSPEKGGDSEGSSDNNPIRLEAVTKEDFRLLLKSLYPPRVKDITSTLNLQQCVSLLQITHMWQFEEIFSTTKNRIRTELWSTVECVDKIKLAHDYNLEDWYKDVYYELALRTRPLSIEEGRKLGVEFSIKMGQVRERVAAARRARKEQVAKEVIDEVFFDSEQSLAKPYAERNAEEYESEDQVAEERFGGWARHSGTTGFVFVNLN